MAWNTPGSSEQPSRNRPKGPNRRGGSLLTQLRDRLEGLFGGGAGGGSGRGFGGADGFPKRIILGALALIVLFNCVVLVTEQERAVVLRFGAYARSLNPGLHLKAPWPIESVTTINATKINSLTKTVPVLTNDENIVQVEVNVQYRVKDAKQYLFGTRNADQVLEQAAMSTVREQVGHNTLDTVLGSRGALAVTARSNLQKSLDAYRTGLFVTELNLPNARPPDEVKPAFDDVNSAQQDKDRLISIAQAYKAKVVPEARGQAANTRTVAQGYKQSVIATATGDAARFDQIVPAYKNAPEATRKRMWLDTVSEVVAQNKVVISGNSKPIIYVPDSANSPKAQQTATEPPVVQSMTEETGPVRATRPARGEGK